jgi:hypothetical protein
MNERGLGTNAILMRKRKTSCIVASVLGSQLTDWRLDYPKSDAGSR